LRKKSAAKLKINASWRFGGLETSLLAFGAAHIQQAEPKNGHQVFIHYQAFEGSRY
jgi:hypothetical protein